MTGAQDPAPLPITPLQSSTPAPGPSSASFLLFLSIPGPCQAGWPVLRPVPSSYLPVASAFRCRLGLILSILPGRLGLPSFIPSPLTILRVNQPQTAPTPARRRYESPRATTSGSRQIAVSGERRLNCPFVCCFCDPARACLGLMSLRPGHEQKPFHISPVTPSSAGAGASALHCSCFRRGRAWGRL